MSIKIKEGKASLDSYSDADLLKIYSVTVEELRLKNEISTDDEIEKLEKENAELRKEIERLESDED